MISCFNCNKLFICKNDDNYYEKGLKKGMKFYCSKKCMIESRTGFKNHNWKGGCSWGDYGKEFDKIKDFIRFRDKFTCQICFKEGKDREIHVHHIDFNKKNNDTKNLILLCRKCHGKQKIPGVLVE